MMSKGRNEGVCPECGALMTKKDGYWRCNMCGYLEGY